MSDWPGYTPGDCVLAPSLPLADISNTGITDVAYTTANEATLQTVLVQEPVIVTKLFCLNGTAVSGNIDMGIYDLGGNRLVSSGSVAQAGISVMQVFDITDLEIGPGAYLLALALDNLTGRFSTQARSNNPEARVDGIFNVLTSFPLPSSLTLAISNHARSYSMFMATRTVI